MRRGEPLDPALLEFRPLVAADLPALHAWFGAPHARRWFGKGRSLASVVEEYTRYLEGREPIHAFVVSYAGRPIGMIEWERFGDFPDLMRAYEVSDPDAVNCDVVIGEAEFAYRGLGAPLVLRFLNEIVFRDPRLVACVIDPDRENTAAIRAYQKAGFVFVRTVVDPEDGKTLLHLMELRRAPRA